MRFDTDTPLLVICRTLWTSHTHRSCRRKKLNAVELERGKSSGRTRQNKQQAAAPSVRASSASVSEKSPCRHFTQPEDCTRHDFELCKQLVTAFDEMCNSAMDARDGMLYVPDLYQAIISTCMKYNGSIHGNEKREAMFRGMVLSLGTESWGMSTNHSLQLLCHMSIFFSI